MKKIIAAIILITISTASASEPLSKKELSDLIGSTVQSCFTTQRADVMNQLMSDEQIQIYCSCFANVIFPPTTTGLDIVTAMSERVNGGDDAMVKYLLKGINLYEITNRCALKASE